MVAKNLFITQWVNIIIIACYLTNIDIQCRLWLYIDICYDFMAWRWKLIHYMNIIYQRSLNERPH